MPESRVLTRLNRATRICHADADADRMAIMTPSVTKAAYVSYLLRIYGFEARIERVLAGMPELSPWADIRMTPRTKHLEADLRALGVMRPDAYPLCDDTPTRDTATAVGWLYVLERNTLVHELVQRYLQQRLPESMKVAGSYLRRSPKHLRELGAVMDRRARDDDMIDRIIYGARVAFRSQRCWYTATQHQRVA